MSETTQARYEDTGIDLTAVIPHDYSSGTAEHVKLLRCTLCGALVEDTWRGGKDTHTEWHARLGH